LLEKQFEKEFTKTYEEETDEEYSKMLLEDKGKEAVSRIIDLQNDLKELGKISGVADPEEEKRIKAEEDEKWFTAVDNVMNKTDRVTYELEDGLKLNIVMDVKDKQLIQDGMDNPVQFLKSMITDEKGAIDHEALFEFIMSKLYLKEILEEARKSGAAHREEKILKEKKNSVIPTGKAGDPVATNDLRDQLAKNFQMALNP
jgi:hypothetical protein